MFGAGIMASLTGGASCRFQPSTSLP